MKEYRIPKYLHRPYSVLFLESEDLAILFLFFTLAIIFGGIFWIFLLVVPIIWWRLKTKYSRGLLRQILYVIGIANLKNVPHYFADKFHE
ncbi:MAG: type IV conjugative transfer system protein TraL [Caldisericum sp.]